MIGIGIGSGCRPRVSGLRLRSPMCLIARDLPTLPLRQPLYQHHDGEARQLGALPFLVRRLRAHEKCRAGRYEHYVCSERKNSFG